MPRLRSDVITFQQTMVTMECWSCSVPYAITQGLYDQRQKDGGEFYCPNGHYSVFTKTQIDIAREERDRARAELRQLQERHERLKADRLRLENDLLDKVKEQRAMERRIHAGVCPFCRRNFANVQRHMSRKHPEKEQTA